MKIRFVKERETKNTHRFQEMIEENETAVVGTLYVQKSALEELGFPENLELEITKA